MKKGLTAYFIILASMLTGFILLNIKPIWQFVVTLFQILLPFVYGGIFAYLLNPLNKHIKSKIENEKLAKSVAVFTCVVVLIGTFTVLIALILPGFFQSVSQIISQSSVYINRITEYFENEELNEFVVMIYNRVSKWITDNLDLSAIPSTGLDLFGNVFYALSTLFTTAKNILIGVVVMIYLLLDYETMGKHFSIYLKKILKDKMDKFIEVLAMMDRAFSSFIRGKLIDSLIIGVLCFILTSIVNIPYALLVSVIVGITNVIPFFGPFIGAVPSALLVLVNNPTKALIFVIIIIILQQFDGNFLGPKILGDKTGLSPFWVLFSIILCGGLFGIVGMIIGVPLFSVLSTLISEWVNIEEKKEA